MLKIPILICFCFIINACAHSQNTPAETFNTSGEVPNVSLIDTSGHILSTRFSPPVGFVRTEVPKNSFAAYLRNLPLKSAGAKVHYYDERIKENYDVYEAVVDMDLDGRDLQQCADAVIRLRAEYLYAQKNYAQINFHFTNGFEADFDKWRKGNRISIDGNNVSWRPSSSSSGSYKSFRKYLLMVFAYAGTYSVEKETKPVKLEDMEIGDIFIRGGSPGHAVIVVDVAAHKDSGKKIFMLAQSYMPAQETQILQNPANGQGNPWYDSNFETLYTPEWTFTKDQLRRYE
jgi:hypothetical protein